MTIVMTDIIESRDNPAYEEPEDEVQEVRVHVGINVDDFLKQFPIRYLHKPIILCVIGGGGGGGGNQ